MRTMIAAGLFVLACAGQFLASSDPNEKPAKNQKQGKHAGPKLGIKTPGVQIPFENLKPLAEIAVAGTPGEITIGEAVWVTNAVRNEVAKIDGKTNKAGDALTGLHKPCSGLTIGFGSLLIPNCGDQSLTRVDLKTGKVSATLPVGTANVHSAVAVNADSIWMLTDEKTTLSRIDPEQNKVVSELRLPAGCGGLRFGETALWLTCPGENKVLRIDPQTNLVTKRIEVSGKPHSIAFGESSVWVLCLADGKVERIDPKTNKVTKTIELGVPNADGEIAFGESFVWVTLTDFPISRIDPQSDKVVQQFAGEGGGAITVGLGSIWLTNAGKGNVWRIDPKRILATLAE
jgi:DNA-binding beta-propeller fold protein YncE